ncbi:MAG: hypothetical protein HGB28_05170 [Oscillochloris sp.]|nr:hypothetical protein [Oscillochloris sp.]
MSSQEVKKGIEYALAFATTGAGASFSIKTFIPLPVIDAVPQTLIVKTMSHQIASIYGYSALKGLTTFTGILVGSASGMKLASEVITFIPVAGPGTSAVTTFALHMSTGIVLVIVFELLQAGLITEDYIQNTTSDDVGFLLNLATQVLLDILRGNDGVDATSEAVEKFTLQNA